MINRAARDQLAYDLRRLLKGQITRRQYLQAFPAGCEDFGVLACWSFGERLPFLWGFPVVREQLREGAHCLLFLQSDLEYDGTRSPEPRDKRRKRLQTVGLYTVQFGTLMGLTALFIRPVRHSRNLAFVLFWLVVMLVFLSIRKGPAFRGKSGSGFWPFRSRDDYRATLRSRRAQPSVCSDEDINPASSS